MVVWIQLKRYHNIEVILFAELEILVMSGTDSFMTVFDIKMKYLHFV